MVLDKGKVAMILDKRKDSGVVVKLVEELRQAILLYQVGAVENHRSSRIDALGIAIATTIYRQSSRTVGCKSHLNVHTARADGRLIEPSLLSVYF